MKPSHTFLLTLLLCLMVVSYPCFSQEDNSRIENNNTASLDEISGIVLDKTITVKGHQFHRHFSDQLLLIAPNIKENLIIYERPSARWGNLIWVQHEANRLFSIFWNPRMGDMHSIAVTAAQQVNQKLQKLRLSELFSDTFDLEKNEF